MAWIDEHLETFVRPVLGYVPNIPTSFEEDDDPESLWNGYYWTRKFTPARIALLNTTWQAAKAKMLQNKKESILLPGRDTFLFEIMAKVEGFEATIFRPEISSEVASGGVKLNPDASKWSKVCYGVDSGYAGTIMTKLSIPVFGLVSFNSTASYSPDREAKQLTPRLNPNVATQLCGDMENCPKYWTRARATDKYEGFTQTTSPLDEFRAAAVLTRHLVAHFDPSVKLEIQAAFDLTLAGRPLDPPRGIVNGDGTAWFFNDGAFNGSLCGARIGVVNCEKAIKAGTWFLGTTYNNVIYPQHTGRFGGSVTACHRCVKRQGLTPPEVDGFSL